MLKITDLCCQYGEKIVLSNVNISFEQNGIYVIMGDSGLGKTTLLNAIAGLTKIESGSIEFTNFPYQQPRISYMFQEPRLIPWLSAKDNVHIVLGGKKESEENAVYLLKVLGLGADVNKYPKELSGGMAQRVSFARTLAKESDIILLDEPFNGLDKENSLRMIEMLKERSKRALVIVVTHSEEYASLLSEQIIRL